MIPSRLESTRLPNKAIRLINGMPMIVRVANAAKNLKLGKVLVASGNKKISTILDKFNIESVSTKNTHKSGTDRIFEAFEKKKYKNIKLIINIQGDLPYFSRELITKLIFLMRDKTVEVGTAVTELKKNEINDPNIVKACANLNKFGIGKATDFKRNIDSLRNYYHHIGVYAFKPESLGIFVKLSSTKLEKKRKLEQMRALENNMNLKVIKVLEKPLSVDNIKDLKKARNFFKRMKSK
tara:strand:- start:41194 stop:41907 length:714 start_codon:yes stop_codon:yes gene_type:complete